MTWPIPIDPTMAYVNEPPTGGTGPNLTVMNGSDVTELLFAATRDILAGEELYIDYGSVYDRTGYTTPPDGQ